MLPDTLLHFVHITDTHLIAPGQTKDFSDIPPELALYAQQVLGLPYHTVTAAEILIQQINALPVPVDFVLHTGDVAGKAHMDYGFMRDLFGQINCPVIYVPGNHDHGEGLALLNQSETLDVREYEMNGVQIVCLDSSRYGKDHGGWLSDAQLAHMEALCTANDPRPLLVAVHHHPFAVDVAWLDNLRLGNGGALHEILRRAQARLRGVFYGHIHHSVDILKDGILYSSVASAAYQFIGWPGQAQASLDLAADPGFNLVTVTRDQTLVRHHRYRIFL